MEHTIQINTEVPIEKLGILLSPTKLEFESNGVLNPGIFQEGEEVHIFYRAVEDGNYSTIGYVKTNEHLDIIERKTSPLITRDFDYEKHGVPPLFFLRALSPAFLSSLALPRFHQSGTRIPRSSTSPGGSTRTLTTSSVSRSPDSADDTR